MIHNQNCSIKHTFVTNDETLLVDQNNRMCIYNELVNGCIFTNRDEFEHNLEKIMRAPESEFGTWGGKQGFLVYLKKRLKKEDKYFFKNRGKITLKNPRYQEYCDDMVLYVALKHVVKGDPISVMSNTEFEFIDSNMGMFNHDPIHVGKLN